MLADRQAILLLVAILTFSMGAMEMSGPFWPLHIQTLLGAGAQQQLALLSMAVYAVPMAASMLLSPLWARLGDRIGHKPMIIRALLALGLFQGAVMFIADPWILILVRCLQGGLAGFLIAAQAYALLCCHDASNARTLASLHSATAVGALLGPILGGWLLDEHGFRFICGIASGICLICAACSCLLGNRHPQRRAEYPLPHLPPLARKQVLGLLGVVVLLQAAKIMPQPFYSLYVAQVLQAPGWVIGATYAASAATLAISAPLWGALFDRKLPAQTLGIIESVTWLCALTMALTTLASSWGGFLATRLAWGVWQGALLPVAYALMAQATDPTRHGFILALGNSAAKGGALLGIGAGALALAWIPLSQSFWMVAGTYVSAALAIRLLRHRMSAPSTHP